MKGQRVKGNSNTGKSEGYRMFFRPGLLLSALLGWMLHSGHLYAQEAAIQGIAIKASDEYPKVLNIIPWQAPVMPRRGKAELSLEMDELLEPLNARASLAHQDYRKTLAPLRPREVR